VASQVDLVVTDLVMPQLDGLTLLRRLMEDDSDRPVIMLTARGSERTAVEAIRAGAFDYLVKPFDVTAIEFVVTRAVEVRQLRMIARDRDAEAVLGRPVVGRSPTFQALLARVARLARRPVPVLVHGETGTGKELVAELLHAHGHRAGGPRITFNCAAVPAGLAEAELFGHAKGAFTGADEARPGFFVRADQGTLVLDEVAELSTDVQPKLLRALQAREVQPVGAGAPVAVDVRIVACSHRDLRAAMDEGTFREDLFYRLAVVELTVPPLRDRREDIRPLAETFRRRYAHAFALADMPLPEALIERFEAYAWPGNVRELENAVAGLMALSDDGSIEADAWNPVHGSNRTSSARGDGNSTEASSDGLRARLRDYEHKLLQQALTESRGNHSEAARRLRITRTTLLDKLKRHRLR